MLKLCRLSNQGILGRTKPKTASLLGGWDPRTCTLPETHIFAPKNAGETKFGISEIPQGPEDLKVVSK